MVSNLIALVALYQFYTKFFQDKISELENERIEELYYGYDVRDIDNLQEQLDTEKANKRSYFKNELKKSDLPLSEKRYYDGQQDMLNKVKEMFL